MRGSILIVIACFLLAGPSFAFDHNHSKWDRVLKTHLDKRFFVNYTKLAAETKAKPTHEFLAYLKDLSNVSQGQFNGWNPQQKMAFLINAYNAFTVKLMVDNLGPKNDRLKSIKDIGGLFTKPWSIKFFTLLGKEMSLDSIEHKMLRPVYKDYRIHAVVNCASVSCPPLRKEAYVATKLEAQLGEQMTLWMKDKTRNKYNGTSGNWQLSKIFDWYEDDFANWGGGVEAVVHRYRPDLEGVKMKDLDYLPYNWNLNGK